jgi:hypothetical protein
MFQAFGGFRIGRPQLFAGLLLLAFLAQCLWVATGRKLSEREYEYIASGYRVAPDPPLRATSPFTSLTAALPVRVVAALKRAAPASIKAALAIPRRWAMRLPFVIFGVWLGGALWWVARRLFGDHGGYVALVLYCFSPAVVMISSNIGPEIILAWSSFGLIYTAIGVAHTTYAPPRKWLPRIIILGVAIGICLSTSIWAFTVVLLAFTFMLYLSPGRRRAAVVVLLGAAAIGMAILWFVSRVTGRPALAPPALVLRPPPLDVVLNLGFVFVDGYVLAALLVVALTAYGTWARARYFGNTAPLIAAFATVSWFALTSANYLWVATLGLSFTFLFVGGVAADLLETAWHRTLVFSSAAIFAIKVVLDLSLLYGWIHQNLM